MTTHNQYEILESLPTSGPMYIPVSENNEPFYSEGFVVKFFKNDGTEWVGNFHKGWTRFNKVVSIPNRNRIIVVAGGLGYIMDPNQHKPIRNFGITVNEILKTEKGSLICSDGISILMIDNESGEIWESDRISFDGIKDLKIQNDILIGKTFDPTNSINEWSDFSLNIETKEIIGGSYMEFEKRNTHIPKFKLNKTTETKPWWKR